MNQTAVGKYTCKEKSKSMQCLEDTADHLQQRKNASVYFYLKIDQDNINDSE